MTSLECWRNLAAAVCGLAFKESYNDDARDFLLSEWGNDLLTLCGNENTERKKNFKCNEHFDFISFATIQNKFRIKYETINRIAASLKIKTFKPSVGPWVMPRDQYERFDSEVKRLKLAHEI